MYVYIYILYMLSVFIPGIIWDDSPYQPSVQWRRDVKSLEFITFILIHFHYVPIVSHYITSFAGWMHIVDVESLFLLVKQGYALGDITKI